MSRTCEEMRAAALLDERREERTAHNADCEACRGLADSDRALKLALQALRAERPAPEALRQAVLRRVQAASALVIPARAPYWRWIVAAALVPVTLLVIIVLWISPSWSPKRAADRGDTELVEFLSKDHLKYHHRRDRAEIETTDAAEIERWFATELELTILMPKLPGAHPVGARRCNLLGRWAALVFFQANDTSELLSLFVFPPRGLEPPGAIDLELGAINGRLLQIQGLDMVFWQRRGLTYALVGKVLTPYN